MTGKDKKELHPNQLPDSDLDGATGGARTLKQYRARCTVSSCMWASAWTTSPEKAEMWRQEHYETDRHYAVVTSIESSY